MIRNTTRDRILHPSPEFATTLLRQAVGLMFARTADRAMVFVFPAPARVRIHTWFVRGSLDVLVLDSESRIVALRACLPPFSWWDAGISARILIELPPGTLAATESAVGDSVAVER